MNFYFDDDFSRQGIVDYGNIRKLTEEHFDFTFGGVPAMLTFIDQNNFDIWLFKTNRDGEVLWDKTY